jgi:GH43 family beta-xylosidase
MHHCLSISQAWESDTLFPYARVNEGPCVIKDNGVYYLTYSANDYRSKGYGIGYATATNIFGPWTKSATNPVLQYAFNMVGTGHHTLFKDKKGKIRVAYHAHYSKSQIHPRRTYFTTMKIKHGKLTMKSK